MSINQTMSSADLLTNCERNTRYHQARARFFNSLNLFIQFLIFSLSAANVSNLVYQYLQSSVLWMWAVVSLLALFSLVYNPAGKATLHKSLHRGFTMLAGMIVATPDADEKMLAEWNKNLYVLYADEPPVFRALNAHCNNQAAIAMDADQGYCVDLRWYHRMFRNWYSFEGADLRNRNQVAQSQ